MCDSLLCEELMAEADSEYCYGMVHAQTAQVDRYNLHPEGLRHLLEAEQHVQAHSYFDKVQVGLIGPKDRELALAELETKVLQPLCGGTAPELFQVTVCLQDRYLSKHPTPRTELWGVCLGCLLMASKVLGSNLACKDVAAAGAVLPSALKEYERKVARGLGWDGTAATPLNFVHELLFQLRLRWPIHSVLLQVLCLGSTVLSTQLVLDSSRLGTPASTLASVALMMTVERSCPQLFDDILQLVLSMTDSEPDSFFEYYRSCKQSLLPSSNRLVLTQGGEEGAEGCGSTTPTTATTPSDAQDVLDMMK